MPLRERLAEHMQRPAFPWLLALFFLALRLPLLTWYRGEYTDSVLLLSLFQNDNSYYPPLFTLCAWIPRALGMDATLAGRLVSLAAAGLCCVPVFLFGKRLQGAGTGLIAVLLLQSAALVNQWAERAMSDALFTLLFTTAAYYGLACFSNDARRRDFAWFLFWSGMASLCRYQGLALLPVIALRVCRRGSSRLSASDLWAALPWLGLGAWMLGRGFGHAGQYAQRTADLSSTLHAYWLMTWGFFRWLPYAMGYLNVALALAGLWLLRSRRRPFVYLCIYLTILWFVAHVPFQSFQFRYFLPLMPLVVVSAAVAWWGLYHNVSPRLRGWVWTGLAAWLLVFSAFSALVLRAQRDAFGDLWQAAAYLRSLPPETRVFADETYAGEVKNYKLAFWSGREIGPLHASMGHLKDGDVAVISSLHEDVASTMGGLQSRWELSDQRTFVVELTPWMGDLMSHPPGLTSTPMAMRYRHVPQRFTTVVVRLGLPRTLPLTRPSGATSPSRD